MSDRRTIVIVLLLLSGLLRAQNYLFEDSIKKLYPDCYLKTDIGSCSRAEWELHFTGLVKEAQELFSYHGTENRNFPPFVLSTFDSSRYTGWMQPLLDSCKKHRIVIMNETHHDPMQRNYSMILLDELYALGYRYLGCEGLNCSDDAIADLNKNKYAKFSSGYYIMEPTYSNLINYALQKGFYVFAYDACDDADERETSQAKKISEILKKDTSAKMMIHCGWGHLREDTAAKVMGYHLKQLTSIDPLTINQTRMRECFKKEFENPIYQKLNFYEAPRFYYEKNSNRLYHDNWGDIILFLPRVKYIHQRPDYLVNNQHLYKKKLDINLLKGKTAIITVSYNNDKNAVPTDVFQVRNFSEDVYLFSLSKEKNIITIRFEDKTETLEANFE